MKLCECGCGNLCKNRFLRGHNITGPRQKSALKCWNCGVTSTDMSIFMSDKRLSSGKKNLCRVCSGSRTVGIKNLIKNMVNAAKNVPCKRCGVRYPPYVMDLHHRDPETKNFGIGKSVLRSESTMRAELEKCDVYCANCHRIIEFGSNQHNR